jgi:hypothetical protein
MEGPVIITGISQSFELLILNGKRLQRIMHAYFQESSRVPKTYRRSSGGYY